MRVIFFALTHFPGVIIMFKQKDSKVFLFINFLAIIYIHPACTVEISPFRIFEMHSLVADFSPDGQFLVISANSKLGPGLYFYSIDSIENGEVQNFLFASNYSDFQFSPDGMMLVGGEASAGPYEDGADLWDLSSNNLVHTFIPNNYYLNYGDVIVALSPDKKYVLTYKLPAPCCTPSLWSTETGRYVRGFEGYSDLSDSTDPDYVSQYAYVDDGGVSLAFSPDGEYLLIDDNLYAMNSFHFDRELDPKNVVYDTDFSTDGSWLIVSDRSDVQNGRERIVIWDWKTKKQLKVLYESEEIGAPYAGHVDISPDNRFLAGGMKNGEIWLWDINKEKIIVQLKAEDGLHSKSNLPKPKFSPDGKYLLSTGEITKNNWTSFCIYLWKMTDILQTSSIQNFPDQK